MFLSADRRKSLPRVPAGVLQFRALVLGALQPTEEVGMSIAKPLALSVLLIAALPGASAALAAKPETFANGRSWYGVSNDPALATRVVDVKSTQAINVNCGDTVTFRSGDKRFTWRFDVANHRAVDLRKIASKDFAVDKLTVYISPNEYERD
jgi:hypothetical protein